MFKDILTRDFFILFIVSFISTILFCGFFSALLISVIIVILKYLYDKYLSVKINPFIDKIVNFIKSKIKK